MTLTPYGMTNSCELEALRVATPTVKGAEKCGFPVPCSDSVGSGYFAPGMSVGARREDRVRAVGHREGAPGTAIGRGHRGWRVAGPLGSPAYQAWGPCGDA
jgi:hypothetical protein